MKTRLRLGLGIGVFMGFLMLGVMTPWINTGNTNENLLDIFKKEYKPPVPLLPPGVTVKPGFEAGEGAAVGNVQAAQGDVYVVHQSGRSAYRLKENLPLFAGDALVTGERSRLNAKMNDKSVFALAPNTKLVIDKSLYNPSKDERSSLLSLLFGKARLIVAKLQGTSQYEVKTPTAVCGVRGSDFGLSVTPIEKKSSTLKRNLASLVAVPDAYAQPAPPLMTIVVTGPDTTVGFAGAVGATQTVGPASVCAAAAGAAAGVPTVVGAAAALGALDAVGPGLASLSMPPGYK